MGNVLVEHHYVEPEFIDSVLERDSHSSTRVAPFVTIPHGNPLYVKHSMISIATMKEPVLWHGEQIRIVLLLAIKKNDLKHAEFKNIFCYSLSRKAARTNGSVDAIQSSARNLNVVI